MTNNKNIQNDKNIYYCDSISIYGLSKILFLLNWHHTLIINENKAHIWHFNEHDRLLIYSNIPIISCNVEYITILNKTQSSSNILTLIQNIANNNNINIDVRKNISHISEIDKLIYCIYNVPAINISSNNQNITNNSVTLNLPIALYQLKKHAEYFNLYQIFTQLFKEIGVHSLLIILHNIIQIAKQNLNSTYVNNSYLLPDMILY